MNRIMYSLVFAAFVMIPGWAAAALVAPRSLVDLAQNADLIVVGSASGTYRVGSVVNFSIEASRVVKGDSSLAGQTISVSWSPAPSIARLGAVRTATGTGIWFLQHANGSYALIPVLSGSPALEHTFLPAPGSPIPDAYQYATSASTNDKIAAEICAAIENANPSLGPQLGLLQYDLLDALNSSVIPVLYQRLAASTSTQQKILGLSGLIRRGSGAALISAIQAESNFATYPQENGLLLASVRNAFRATDANSISSLGAAATDFSNSNSAFRAALAHALSSIHTKEALPYLAALLDDPVAELRAEGVGGLGAFANGLAAQASADVASLRYLQIGETQTPYRTEETIQNFARGQKAIEQNESRYLAFWKNWWSQNRTALGY